MLRDDVFGIVYMYLDIQNAIFNSIFKEEMFEFGYLQYKCLVIFMPPTSKKLREHIGLGLSM